MTIHESDTILFQWFLQNDSFSIDENFQECYLPISNEDTIKLIALKSLDNYEKEGLVSKLSDNLWVLNKSLFSYKQVVEIPGELAMIMGEKINEYCHMYDDEENLCNPLSISLRDIENLFKIINTLEEDAGQIEFEEDEDEDDE